MADERPAGIPLASETMVRVRLITADPLRSRAAVYAALAGLPSVKRVASSASDAGTFWLTTRSMAALLSEVTQAPSLAEAQVSWEPTEGLILRLPVDLDRGRDRAITWSGEASREPSSFASAGGVQEAVLNWNREDGWILRTTSPPDEDEPVGRVADPANAATGPGAHDAAATDLDQTAEEPDDQVESVGVPTATPPSRSPDIVKIIPTRPPASGAEARPDEAAPRADRLPEGQVAEVRTAKAGDAPHNATIAPVIEPKDASSSSDVEAAHIDLQAPAAPRSDMEAAETADSNRAAMPVEAASDILTGAEAVPAQPPERAEATPSPATVPLSPPVEEETSPPVFGRKASLDRARADQGQPPAPGAAPALAATSAVPAAEPPAPPRRTRAGRTRPRRRRWPFAVAALLLPLIALLGLLVLREGRDRSERIAETGVPVQAGGALSGAGVLTVFGDALAAGWRDASRGASVDAVDRPVYAGNRSLAVAFTQALGEFVLDFGEALDSAVFSHLRFALQPAQSGQPLRLSLRDGAGQTLGTPVALADLGGPSEAGAWKLYNIALADLGATGRQVRGLTLQDASGSAQPPLYLDDLAFVGPPAIAGGLALARTATATPSSDPTRAPASATATATAAARTPTPSPAPTLTPSPVPSPTPTSTPLRTATATPATTATATQAPTQTPTRTPTPTATPAATPTARPAISIARSFEPVCRMRPDRRPCDATGRALWNGEIGAWQLLAVQNRQAVPDEDRVLAETIRLRLEMGDAATRVDYARRRGESAVFISGATFLPQAGAEPLAHVQIELDNRGFASADLAGAEVVTEGGDVLLAMPPGATLAAGSRCRLSTGPAVENPCVFNPVRANRVRSDRPVALILRTAAGGRIDTLDLPPVP